MATDGQLGVVGGAADPRRRARRATWASCAADPSPNFPGVQITTVEPKPAGGYVEYLTYNVHIVTAAMGVTYEMATGDMTQVNFSSARVRLGDVRRGFEQTQWLTLIPRAVRPIADTFAQLAILAGKVRGTPYGIEYDTPKWDYVNPLQEAQADALQIANGLSSISAKLRARGENPDRVFAKWPTTSTS
jgi:capsid protein